MNIVQIENVNKIYQDNGIPVHALKNLSLDIEEGEFLVISGPSGSGKTTLLNVIGSLDKPNDGKVLLMGDDLAQKSKSELSAIRLNKIGFIFQAYNLIPVLTAIENVEFPMMLLGYSEKERRGRAQKVLDELEIGHLSNKRPNEMSGGQQQRVAVARAIANEPVLVLADEPTANLDSKSGDVLLDIMKEMNEKKKITFIFSSHDKQVMDRAKRLLVLKDGEIVDEKVNA
jgi:putative ABC transport system ATP-binding protein